MWTKFSQTSHGTSIKEKARRYTNRFIYFIRNSSLKRIAHSKESALFYFTEFTQSMINFINVSLSCLFYVSNFKRHLSWGSATFLEVNLHLYWTPSRITTSKWIFWLYILSVQYNFYQNITEICILSSNKILGTAIHLILYAKHLKKFCQLEQSWNNHILINYEWSGYDNSQLQWCSENFV